MQQAVLCGARSGKVSRKHQKNRMLGGSKNEGVPMKGVEVAEGEGCPTAFTMAANCEMHRSISKNFNNAAISSGIMIFLITKKMKTPENRWEKEERRTRSIYLQYIFTASTD